MPLMGCPLKLRAIARLSVIAALLATHEGSPQQPPAPATSPGQAATPPAQEAPRTPAKAGTFMPEELEQMVAPIALYPDPLLAQVLMASTYPLEIVEAARWSKANPTVTGDAVADALQNTDWDPSVKSLATFPDVLAMMDEKLDWTQKLGDAFLAQQTELMDSVQRLRAKAHAEGTLMSSKEQNVLVEPAPAAPAQAAAAAPAGAAAPAAAAPTEPAPAAQTTIIKIEPADPEIVYVPTYNPTVVYGAWPYPAYPPYYYYPPMYPPGAAFFSFTAGVIVGGALWGNCNWGWGSSDVDININRNNEFNRNNIGNNVGTDGKWKHDPSHRKGAQYRDSATQNQYGRGQNSNAVASREAFRGRADQGRQDIAAGGATRDLAGNQLGGANASDRLGGGQTDASNRAGGGQTGAGNRAGQGGAASNTGARTPQAQPSNLGSSADRSAASTNRGSEAFRGTSSGSSTRSASQRGYSSRSSGGFSGGGYRGGGGGRGGGGRR
jgi:Protein of unknown function (DUF3300)